jgi:hypothetical protein
VRNRLYQRVIDLLHNENSPAQAEQAPAGENAKPSEDPDRNTKEGHD